uniref:Uncharacterized protein n=1 Tax=Setaria italica TaxID=4555 RepID=K3ZGT7_SETIT
MCSFVRVWACRIQWGTGACTWIGVLGWSISWGLVRFSGGGFLIRVLDW